MKRAIPFILILLFVSTSYAEPGKSIQSLMDTPVSMFDWGLYRIEKDLEEYSMPGIELSRKSRVSAQYDGDADQITLKVAIYSANDSYSSDQNRTGADGTCRKALMAIKAHFGYGSSSTAHDRRSIARAFRPGGEAQQEAIPASLEGDLEEATNIQVDVYSGIKDKGPFIKQSSCMSRFLEEQITFLTGALKK